MRLHQVGRCHLIPGVDYRDFVQFTDFASAEYDKLCDLCFGGRSTASRNPPTELDGLQQADVSDEDSSTSSSNPFEASSDSPDPEAKTGEVP